MALNIKELAQLIGAAATWHPSQLTVSVPVTILDARESFGRVDVLVTVRGGQGEQWTQLDRVEVARVARKGGAR